MQIADHRADDDDEHMHEASIMKSALEYAEEQARQAGATRVHRLRLKVGNLSGVVPEALRFAFDALCAGTMTEGAALEIVSVPAVCWCQTCQAEFDSPDFAQECPRCHEVSMDLRRGRELEMESMEIS